MKSGWKILFVLLAVLLPSVCLAATHLVQMSSRQFVPNTLTIDLGDTVTWTNRDLVTHDITSGQNGVPDGVFSSNDQYGRFLNRGETYSFTFNSGGTFPYYCTPHWELFNMKGSITVRVPNQPPSIFIDSPGNNADFAAPADITIQATVFDSDGNVDQVEFFINGDSLGTSSQPYSKTVTGLGAGGYTFSVTATDNAGAQTTRSVFVTVTGQSPVITTSPQSQTVNEGSDITFTVQASGSQPLSYQWFFEQSPIGGANGSSLTLTSVSNVNAGNYTVEVTNTFGTASTNATLTVTNPPAGSPPSITTHPQSQTVDAGTNVTFSVAAIGSTPLRIQWFFQQSLIPDETNSTLVISNVSSANEGDYFAVVTNAFGSDTSFNATLTVIVPPVCSFTLSKSNASFTPAGGTGTVVVTTLTNCSWAINNSNFWVQFVSGISGTGTRTVTFRVLTNASRTSRTAVLTIASNTFTINQAGTPFKAKNDFNRDGISDFLFQHNDGRVALWLMNRFNISSTLLLRNASPGWRIVGTEDFNRDGKVDILWQHNTGPLGFWVMNGTTFVRSEQFVGVPALASAWKLVGLGDLNRDNKADFIFRHADGYLLAWFMDGKKFLSQQLIFDGDPVPPEWRVVGVADLRGDGPPEIFWQNPTGSLVIWLMAGTQPHSGILLSDLPPLPGQLTGMNDLNQDGLVDFIWRHGDGHLSTWIMNDAEFVRERTINGGKPVGLGWKLVAPQN